MSRLISIWFLYTPVFTSIYAPIFLLPEGLGPYVWNVFNYVMLCMGIRLLPKPLAPFRTRIFLFMLLLILQSAFIPSFGVILAMR